MSLILYPSNETAFDTNGIGILSEALNDEVYQELNGQYELTLQYPVDGLHFADIALDAYITAESDPVSAPQPFRIYRITKPMNGLVTIYARHNAYRLKKIVVSPFSVPAAYAVPEALKKNAVNACPFAFWTDITTAVDMNVRAPKDIWSLLGGSIGSILDTYGGEYEFDKWTVKLHTRRGTDRGVSIRYGKNLTDLKQDENIANVYTGVYPYWMDYDGNLVQLPEKYINGPGAYDEEKIMPLDLSGEFEIAPTIEQLRKRTEKYIADNDIGKPTVSWTVSFVQLEETEEYKGKAWLEQILLGDTVSVIFPKLGVDASARAVACRYKPSLGRYISITLGKVKSNIATTIVQQGQAIQSKPSQTAMDRAVAAATAWLTNGQGYKVERQDKAGNAIDTLYMDTPDINTAVNVLRIGQSGIGFSHNGVNGPYVYAWTIDGKFNNDFITALTISSDGLAYLPPTHADVMDMLWSATFPESWPPKDYYDLNGDGKFDINDVRLAIKVYEGKVDISECAGAIKTAVTVAIESGNSESPIKISGLNMWGSEITISLSANGSRIPMIKGDCTVSGRFTAGKETVVQSLALSTTDTAKKISWRDNGDGTYTLIGTDPTEEGTE